MFFANIFFADLPWLNI